MQNEYKVYLIREIASGEIKYIGLTRQELIMRFNEHVIRRKFKRYDYQIELISDNLTIDQAASLERLLIKQYDLLNKGWNKSPGSINGYSNNHSEEQKLKWKKERPGKKVSEEHSSKNKIARLGKKNSDYHNQRISECNSKRIICLETGLIYPSARAAAKHLNLHYSKISLVCNGKRKTTGGFHFKFVDEPVETNRNVSSQINKSE